jgi:hypothetical protein
MSDNLSRDSDKERYEKFLCRYFAPKVLKCLSVEIPDTTILPEPKKSLTPSEAIRILRRCETVISNYLSNEPKDFSDISDYASSGKCP